jgi:hypothetical protein
MTGGPGGACFFTSLILIPKKIKKQKILARKSDN